MRRSRFTDEEIAHLLDEARRGVPIERLCRDANISLRTFYRWRRRLGDLTLPSVRNLARLEEENRRLRRKLEELAQPGRGAGATPRAAQAQAASSPFALSARSTATLAGRFSMPRTGAPYDLRATLMARDLLNRRSNKPSRS